MEREAPKFYLDKLGLEDQFMLNPIINKVIYSLQSGYDESKLLGDILKEYISLQNEYIRLRNEGPQPQIITIKETPEPFRPFLDKEPKKEKTFFQKIFNKK